MRTATLTSRHRSSSAVALAAISQLFVALPTSAAPALPVVVPDEMLTREPFRNVGTLITDPFGTDPAVLGSGWVASDRVVVSAAHVFFVEETLGWNRNPWLWRRATKPSEFWSFNSTQTPRAFRALAGYAAAVQREETVENGFLDEATRDAIALLFYLPVTTEPPLPRAVDQMSGTGSFMIAGYPVSLAGQPLGSLGQMYAHLGGSPATFEQTAGEDYLGRAFALYETPDLQSGPGGSGGPVLRNINGTWTAVGVLIAGTTDFSSVMQRGLDGEFELLIQQAIDDFEDTLPAAPAWERTDLRLTAPPVRRADGSIVVAAVKGQLGLNEVVQAIDAQGVTLWETPMNAAVNWVAETPDGRIIASSQGTYSLNGVTGQIEWFATIPWSAGVVAISEGGEVVGGGFGQLRALSVYGQESWFVQLPEVNSDNSPFLPAIGPDGTIHLVMANRVHAIDAHTREVRWRSNELTNISKESLAIAPDGAVFIIADGKVVKFSPDGSVVFSAPITDPVGNRLPVVLGDGSMLVPSNSDPFRIHHFDSTGADKPVRLFTLPTGISSASITIDQANATYLGSDQGQEIVDSNMT